MLEASWQVELFHPVWKDSIWTRGVALEPVDREVVAWNEAAVAAWGEAGGSRPEVVDPLSLEVDKWVNRRVKAAIDGWKIPAVLGGEHSVALGAILAANKRHGDIGVLQIDAHADLRVRYEGLDRSHASVMHNLLELAPCLTHLVQVGLRDVGRAEHARIEAEERLSAFFDHDMAERMIRGAPWSAIVTEILALLPDKVWVSFDVDGLEPSLCPYTGTPVPGGLTWRHATYLLRELARSGRRVIGGRGINPDHDTEPARRPHFINELWRKALFANFVADLEREGREPAGLEVDRKLLREFRKYLDDTGFEYQPNGGGQLDKLAEIIELESYGSPAERALRELREAISSSLDSQFDAHREWLELMLELELSDRRHGPDARLLKGLEQDEQYQAARALLSTDDMHEYHAILVN